MKRPSIPALTALAALLLCGGCTVPLYERTVVKTYDGNGVLQSAVVTERVTQPDPNGRPLLDVLETQTYQKQP
jgi:hypothetical protein